MQRSNPSPPKSICRENRFARRSRLAFTLLELMLALSLTVIILLAISMAVDIHLRSLNTRRTQLEEAQLARSILRMIADDLRGTVLHYEQDTSTIQTLLQQSVASAAQSVGQAAGGALSPSTGSSSQTPQGASSATSEGSEGIAAAASSAAATLSGATGSSSGSASSSGLPEESMNTADLSTTTIPKVPGLFGNQYQLQVDISRLPRMENYQQYLTEDAATTVLDVTSDVKTVTYYVQSNALPDLGSNTSVTPSLQDLTDPDANGTGLVRRELDRSVTLWAMNNGNYTGLQNTGDVLAPEVAAIEFQYFDGTDWLVEWDTELEQKLPIAVLVILAIRAPGTTATPEVSLSELTTEIPSGLHLYRMLVYLPAGGQSQESESASAESSSTTGSSSEASGASSSSTGASP